MTPATTTRCAVVGLGIMGSMALLSLAEDGVDCVGYDIGRAGHPHGASGGGETRIFRSTSTDGPDSSRLLASSRDRWQELGGLLTPCGALSIGPAEHDDVADGGHGQGVEVLGRSAAAERWPMHVLGPGDHAVLDRRGGLLPAGASVRSAVRAAQRLGAEVRPDTPVRSITRAGGRVLVRTDAEERAVDSLVLATGRWLPLSGDPFADRVEHRRVVLTWFGVDTTDFGAADFGAATFPPGQRSGSDAEFSFFPTVDGALVKINMQVRQPVVLDPGDLHPDVPTDYAARWAPGLRRQLSGLVAGPERVESYVEGYTAHRRGLVRLVATEPRIVAVGGFSGRGFKYAPAVGEIAARLAVPGGRCVRASRFSWPGPG